jgi:hypothetical protein
LPELAADVEAVAVGQAHIQQNEVRLVVTRKGQSFRAGGFPSHGKGVAFQARFEALADGEVIFYDENVIVLHHTFVLRVFAKD